MTERYLFTFTVSQTSLHPKNTTIWPIINVTGFEHI